ncbi:hypothetical protein GUITHDRAFT_152083 [Guillardia theta CCMP2712]|uniref:PSII 6.1 kDa protein n=2 Tax=Guillardia theta TaxID=55529 RepID=L1JFS1_GUITC|nr:hypothetical protein GUITHDRAFT_152083 [Guillardia theta CCMP2712]EKX47331.1 hypothetical protein GUITHDRAFT_152083 [Guillardia theta CCMP2712]|eukprot:XP_005834311.1 hypothetical protein GUITHDRAFT_152083 [Guillardia theta CCMP2712]
MLRAALLLALVAAAAAFTAPHSAGLRLRSATPAMSMKADSNIRIPEGVKKALAPAIAFAGAAAPAFAEGTGEALGVDDGKLLIPIIVVPLFVFLLFQGFAANQDNEDFFDTYDQRRR